MFHWLLKIFLKRIARAKGFVDPFRVIGQLQAFAQPSEVAAPVELLRLSSVLQVRGLVNAQAIQHNLDWIWPYWVQKQFNPRDEAFVPRAFSMTHINLTHRNWTAVGLPEVREIPVVDPAGAVMPHYDSWTVDCWLYENPKSYLGPSADDKPEQTLSWENGLTVRTVREKDGRRLELKTWVENRCGIPHVCIETEGVSPSDARIVVSLRPMNAEGVSFIQQIQWEAAESAWIIDKKQKVFAVEKPDQLFFSHYRDGDVFGRLDTPDDRKQVKCSIGMATAAIAYRIKPGESRSVQIDIPLKEEPFPKEECIQATPAADHWSERLRELCQLHCPDEKFQFLYDAAVRTLILHAPGRDVYPGPYTYKHFWFRDAAFILDALLAIGNHRKAEEVIDSFRARQTAFGHFLSQDGEWDSNGQALWIYERYYALTRRLPYDSWQKSIEKGVKWIQGKRTPAGSGKAHAGLLPAGFSAEHLGPNDFYYWDDFWGVQGLRSAARLYSAVGKQEEADLIGREADDFLQCIEQSLAQVQARLQTKAMPSSPYRRLDTGSIGSIAAGYPLRLWQPQDPRLLATVDYLLENCMVNDGFFHDMSHSGINAYLTLELAQVLLRAGDSRFERLMQAVADLATPAGQWPEAVHPRTRGGCMGDGQHVWAAAEWILMIRSCFVMEEDDRLILCAGIPAAWLEARQPMRFGPVWTRFGTLTVFIDFMQSHPNVHWEGSWHGDEPQIEVKLGECV